MVRNLRLDKNTLTTRLNSALEDLSGKAIPGEQGKLVAISNETVGLNDIGFYADLLVGELIAITCVVYSYNDRQGKQRGSTRR